MGEDKPMTDKSKKMNYIVELHHINDQKGKEQEALSSFKSTIETREKIKGKAIEIAQQAIEYLKSDDICGADFLLSRAKDYISAYNAYHDLFPLRYEDKEAAISDWRKTRGILKEFV